MKNGTKDRKFLQIELIHSLHAIENTDEIFPANCGDGQENGVSRYHGRDRVVGTYSFVPSRRSCAVVEFFRVR
jgi:hypothetical protein